MARLTAEQWEQARAEYEVRWVSLGEVAKQFGVTRQAVSKQAQAVPLSPRDALGEILKQEVDGVEVVQSPHA